MPEASAILNRQTSPLPLPLPILPKQGPEVASQTFTNSTQAASPIQTSRQQSLAVDGNSDSLGQMLSSILDAVVALIALVKKATGSTVKPKATTASPESETNISNSDGSSVGSSSSRKADSFFDKAIEYLEDETQVNKTITKLDKIFPGVARVAEKLRVPQIAKAAASILGIFVK